MEKINFKNCKRLFVRYKTFELSLNFDTSKIHWIPTGGFQTNALGSKDWTMRNGIIAFLWFEILVAWGTGMVYDFSIIAVDELNGKIKQLYPKEARKQIIVSMVVKSNFNL
jgi:hypothetical protein